MGRPPNIFVSSGVHDPLLKDVGGTKSLGGWPMFYQLCHTAYKVVLTIIFLLYNIISRLCAAFYGGDGLRHPDEWPFAGMYYYNVY
jgi:hypothetical protein